MSSGKSGKLILKRLSTLSKQIRSRAIFINAPTIRKKSGLAALFYFLSIFSSKNASALEIRIGISEACPPGFHSKQTCAAPSCPCKIPAKARVHSPTTRMRLFLVRSSPLPKERYALFAIGRCEAAKSKNPSYQSEPETDAQHPKAALW